MKIIIIDTETTGLDYQKHEIIELGAILTNDVDFIIEEEINLKIKPKRIDLADKKALEVNGYNALLWQDAISINQALEILNEKIKEHIFCAYNYHFDASFLEEAYKKENIDNPFHYHKIDILSIAYSKIPHDKLSSWSLNNVCKSLEIPPENKIHRAINGARSAYEVYKKLMKQ